MNELFLDVNDGVFKKYSEIIHDKEITGNPVTPDYKFSWKIGYIADNKNFLWEGIQAVNIIFKIITNQKIENVLDLQSVIESRQIKPAQSEDFYLYDVGEIEVKCLVKYNNTDDKTYRSALGTIHKHNSIGKIVGLRVLNSEILIPKFEYRYKTHEAYWDLYPDNIVIGRFNQYGVKISEIKSDDIFWASSLIGWVKVKISNKSLPIIPDMPDSKVWIEIIDFDRKAGQDVGMVVPGFYEEVNNLMPQTQLPPPNSQWQTVNKKIYDKALNYKAD